MARVKIGLCLLSATSTLLLVLALPAAAAPDRAAASTTGGAATAGKIPSAIVPTSAKPPKVTQVNAPAGAVLPMATQDGACNSLANGDGDVCYWFSTNFVGSLSDFFTMNTNLNNSRFLTPGLGLGESVGNNSESILNADSNLSVLVFTGTNFTGTGGMVAPRAFGNFNTTFANNVESHEFVG